MKRDDFETMGDLHKQFEAQQTTHKLMPGLPVVARLDGRSFHSFTKTMARPYDANLAQCMLETACYLVRETHADIAYRQSDEITLVWANQDVTKEMLFGGKTHKLLSVLAAMATAKFNQAVGQHLPAQAHKLPVFDCRVYQYPTLALAAETLVWREADAIRNSLSMLAQAHFSHQQLQGKSTTAMTEMLAQKGITWKDMPTVFKRGVFVQKTQELKTLSAAKLALIPAKHRPIGPVLRTAIKAMDMPPLATLDLDDLVEVVFFGAEPFELQKATTMSGLSF